MVFENFILGNSQLKSKFTIHNLKNKIKSTNESPLYFSVSLLKKKGVFLSVKVFKENEIKELTREMKLAFSNYTLY